MVTRGIIALSVLAACAAGAADVAVGPAVVYGSPVEERALAYNGPPGLEVWEVKRDFAYGLSGVAERAPFELAAGAAYFSAAEGRDNAYSIEDLRENGWSAGVDFKYVHNAPPLNAALRTEYGRAETEYDEVPAPGATPFSTATTRYTCEYYSVAATVGPRFEPWGRLRLDLSVGPGLKIVRRDGESYGRRLYVGYEARPIGYKDRLVEFHYVGECTVPVTGRFALQLSVAGIPRLAEPRDQYPADDGHRFYAEVSPRFTF